MSSISLSSFYQNDGSFVQSNMSLDAVARCAYFSDAEVLAICKGFLKKVEEMFEGEFHISPKDFHFFMGRSNFSLDSKIEGISASRHLDYAINVAIYCGLMENDQAGYNSNVKHIARCDLNKVDRDAVESKFRALMAHDECR